MISIHLSDVLMYLFSDNNITNFLFNLKKINILNCLSHEDSYNSFFSYIQHKKFSTHKISKKRIKIK